MRSRSKTNQYSRRGGLNLYVLRLLVQAFLYNSLAPALAGQLEDDNRVLLCTSQGYKWVSLDVQSTETSRSDVRCALCLVPDDNADLVIDEYIPSFTSATVSAKATSISSYIVFGHSPQFFSLSRAPPASLDNTIV